MDTGSAEEREGAEASNTLSVLGIVVDADSDGGDEQWLRPVRRLLPAFESH